MSADQGSTEQEKRKLKHTLEVRRGLQPVTETDCATFRRQFKTHLVPLKEIVAESKFTRETIAKHLTDRCNCGIDTPSVKTSSNGHTSSISCWECNEKFRSFDMVHEHVVEEHGGGR